MKIIKLLSMLVLAQFANNSFCAEAAAEGDVGTIVINGVQYMAQVMSEQEIKESIFLSTLTFCKKNNIIILNAKKVKQTLRRFAKDHGYTSLSDSQLYGQLKRELIIQELYKLAGGLPASFSDEKSLTEKITIFMTQYQLVGTPEDTVYIHNEFIKRQKERLKKFAARDPKVIAAADLYYSQHYPEHAHESEFRLAVAEDAKKKCANPDCKKVYEIKDLKKCSACNIVYYCSADCQKADWLPRHKANCKKYKQQFLMAKKIKPEDRDKDSDGKEKDTDGSASAAGAGSGSAT